MKLLASILLIILAIAGCNKPVATLENRLVSPDEPHLRNIDSIITDAIHQRAMPGCRLFAAKNGHPSDTPAKRITPSGLVLEREV